VVTDPGTDLAAARRYESWYETPFGRRADAIERGLLTDRLSEFRGARTLLEVGSGTGHFADLWAEAGLDAVGIDVAIDRLLFSRGGRPAFPVARGNALVLPFGDDSFDIVAMVTALEFIDPPLEALSEAIRVARRGFIVGALNRWSPVAWWRHGRMASSYGGTGFFSPRSLVRLAGRLGLRDPVIRWRTGLYPVSWLDGLTGLPFGAFVVMSVSLDKEST